jgi:D-arginine dehydrogenase
VKVDFLVIGGGIAGVSAAAHLAPHGTVALVEQESSLAYHTTGRSAATFILTYGSPGARAMARGSQAFFESPPDYAVDSALLTPRGVAWVARPDQIDNLDAIAEQGATSGAGSRALTPDQTMELLPILNPYNLGGSIFEPSARDIDVAGLHQAFVRILRKHDGTVALNSAVTAIDRSATKWRVDTSNESYEAGVVVNASGAWGDVTAAMAGITPIGLQPMRRTAFMVPGAQEYAGMPMVVGVGNDYYFRPDGSQLLCSLSEEEPSDPSDPRPRMEDVALAIERINEVTTLEIRTVNSQWTGLRTFAPDREFVIGEDPTAPGFFWLVGQGGSGIMTAPAFGALIASQVLDQEVPAHLAAAGVDPATTDPARFRS